MSDRTHGRSLVVGGLLLFAGGVLLGVSLLASVPAVVGHIVPIVSDPLGQPTTFRLPIAAGVGTAVQIVVLTTDPTNYHGYLTITDAGARGLPLALTDRGHDAIALGLEPGLSVITVALTNATTTPGLVVRIWRGNGWESLFGTPNIHTQLIGGITSIQAFGSGYSVLSARVVAAPTE